LNILFTIRILANHLNEVKHFWLKLVSDGV
jgi:hypothetical protein